MRIYVASLALGAMMSLAASAQDIELNEQKNFSAERLRPAMDKESIVDVEWAAVPEHMSYDLGVWLWYAHNPLVLYGDVDGKTSRIQTLVGSRVGGSFTGQLSLYDFVEIGVAVPLIVYQGRSPPDLTHPTGGLLQPGLQAFGMGDLRLSPKFAVLREEKHKLGLTVTPTFTLPTAALLNGAFGNDIEYMGEQFLTFSPEIAVSKRLTEELRVAGNIGLRFRPDAGFLDLLVTHELFYRLGVAYRLDELINAPVEVQGALGGQNGSLNPFAAINRNPLELLGGVAYDITPELQLRGDLGVGILAGYATPDFRILSALLWAPRPPKDPDGDGLTGDDDKCPNVAEDVDQFEDEDGCEDPDNDEDGILDSDDRCPMEPEDKDEFEDEDGCPDPDNDGDGIADKNDVCPNEPGVEEKRGCPITDQDQDGILDEKDACPTEPEDRDQFEDEDGCPDPDNDGDQVPDTSDACPLIPEDRDGFEDDNGCPDLDNDKDGFADADDKCPNEPETINGNQDDDGCPDKGKSLVVLTKKKIEILDKVYFDVNKDTIKAVSFNLLKQVSTILKRNPQITKVRVEGHTDSQGGAAYNLDLSDRRAKSVARFLEAEGVDGARLEGQGFGEAQPIDTNDTRDGRANNRRVEFKIVELDGKPVDATETIEVEGEKTIVEQEEE